MIHQPLTPITFRLVDSVDRIDVYYWPETRLVAARWGDTALQTLISRLDKCNETSPRPLVIAANRVRQDLLDDCEIVGLSPANTLLCWDEEESRVFDSGESPEEWGEEMMTDEEKSRLQPA
jgi:hypothetical protein